MTLPKEVENRLNDIFSASAKRGGNLPRSIADLEAIPYECYSSLIQDISSRRVTLIHAVMAWNLQVFKIISTRSERAILYSAITAPFIIAIATVVLAFFFYAYWLLPSVLWLFLASVFSSRQFPFRNIFPMVALAGTGLAAAAGMPVLAGFCFTYFLYHAAYTINRYTFASVILNRALSSELAFCFLYEARHIDLLDPETGNYRYNRSKRITVAPPEAVTRDVGRNKINVSRLLPEEVDRIYQKATAAGLDPLREPVGAWLANICSIWAILFEVSVVFAFRFPTSVIAAVILLVGLIQACRKFGAYTDTSLFMSLLMSLIMAPFTAPSAFIITILGEMNSMK